MNKKQINVVQKKGVGNSGEQTFTYTENNYVVSPDCYTHLNKTKIGGIIFDPHHLREVIVSINLVSKEIHSRQTDFTVVDIEQKNIINGLTQEYYNTFVAEKFEPYFNELDEFLSLRENEDLQNKISNIIETLNSEIYVRRENYDTFESLLLDIHNSILDSEYKQLSNMVQTIKFVIYYLYANCYIGRKSKREN